MANGTTSAWTDERIETVRQLWAEGFSASEIANHLRCGVTRNAVIGKLHRLGFAGRPTPARPPKRNARATRRSGVCRKYKKAKAMPKEPPQPCEPLNVSILDVKPNQCRAVTDASEWGRAKMCGHPCAPNSVYCAGHDAMFYNLHDRKAKAL